MKPIHSHPDALLSDHLQRVADRNRTVLAERRFAFREVEHRLLTDLGYIAGAVHDMGKATREFQHYLFGRPHGFKDHALISAYAGYFLAKKYLENTVFQDEELGELLPYLVFVAVKRHHGNLRDFEVELPNERTEKEKKLPTQLDNFHHRETESILNERLAPLGLMFKWELFDDFVRGNRFLADRCLYATDYVDEWDERSVEQSIRNFYLHQILYAGLLFADKSDVILQKDVGVVNTLDVDAVERYRKDNRWNDPKSDIARRKNEAYFSGLRHLRDHFDPNRHLYSVSMPTGLGKTVTSFALALEMRRQLENPAARIIITIPFTSIIDQNFEVYADILGNPDSTQLIKHHHLTSPRYNIEKEDQIRNPQESQFLIETWQSEVVVTTFVQLLECLFTDDKSKLLKLPNLANAIIILDEVQNIPYSQWRPIREVFRFLGEQMNCYFILMSATQPLIFDPREMIELIPNYKCHFRFFNRTKLINRLNRTTSLQELVSDITERFEQRPEESILIILNTIDCTRTCFEALRDSIPAHRANLYFLSTRITPYERKDIIARIKRKDRDNDLPDIIVSTQLIEAGVDISVHTVYRAFAPLDSIIQAAGRANRYAERDEPSEVFLYDIEELKNANKLIYGGILLNKTQKVIGRYSEIEEKNYLELVEAYFREIRRQSDASNNEILEAMAKLEFNKVGEFKVIPDKDTESIFVQLNQDAVAVWNMYVNLVEDPTLTSYERKRRFASFRGKFYDYVINVYIPHDAEHIAWPDEPVHYFYLWQLNDSNDFYRYEAGNYRENVGYVSQLNTYF